MATKSLTKSRETLNDLETRFLDGDRLTVNEIIDEYLPGIKTVINRMQAETTARGWLNSLRGRFTKKHNLWFGNLNDKNQYGLCFNEAEYNYVITKYYIFAKGILRRAVQVKNEATNNGLLINEETIYLPKLKITEEI